MRGLKRWAALLGLAALVLSACGDEPPVDPEKLELDDLLGMMSQDGKVWEADYCYLDGDQCFGAGQTLLDTKRGVARTESQPDIGVLEVGIHDTSSDSVTLYESGRDSLRGYRWEDRWAGNPPYAAVPHLWPWLSRDGAEFVGREHEVTRFVLHYRGELDSGMLGWLAESRSRLVVVDSWFDAGTLEPIRVTAAAPGIGLHKRGLIQLSYMQTGQRSAAEIVPDAFDSVTLQQKPPRLRRGLERVSALPYTVYGYRGAPTSRDAIPSLVLSEVSPPEAFNEPAVLVYTRNIFDPRDPEPFKLDVRVESGDARWFEAVPESEIREAQQQGRFLPLANGLAFWHVSSDGLTTIEAVAERGGSRLNIVVTGRHLPLETPEDRAGATRAMTAMVDELRPVDRSWNSPPAEPAEVPFDLDGQLPPPE